MGDLKAAVVEGEWGDEAWLLEVGGSRVIDHGDKAKLDEAAERLNRIFRRSTPHTGGEAEPVAWRVRRKTDDPEEWQLRPAGAALDFGNPDRWEIQPLYARPQSQGGR